ncbi:hypothetical protein KCU65_g8263, partial [Aureobasidium melanogenum]
MAETTAISGVKRKRNLFDDEGLSDVIIKIRSKQVFAHKAILANGSVWFERAFLGRFVHLYGLSYKTQLVPTHIMDNIGFHLEVFMLGDKYDISSLRIEAADRFIHAVHEQLRPSSLLGIQDPTIYAIRRLLGPHAVHFADQSLTTKIKALVLTNSTKFLRNQIFRKLLGGGSMLDIELGVELHDLKKQKKSKTYSSRDSHVVTHRSTNLPFNCLCMAERTGCPVFS